MNIEATIVSKRPELLLETTAAVPDPTGNKLRHRSACTAEALRLAAARPPAGMRRPWRALSAALLLGAGPAIAAVPTTDVSPSARLPRDLTELNLAELMNIEVTSVSRREEPLQQAAAAVFVLTGDEIHRSGARSIPEALRRVPGLHVARNGDINTYAVSARGFADRLSDKLEVLIDGRTVYTPLFAGVFWDSLDIFLPDIERIEVIRGPGAALWGTNAINGVINIVTKSAAATAGQLFNAGVGTEERSFAALRSGADVGEAGHARLYVKHFERDALKRGNGTDSTGGQRFGQAGFRSDWRLGGAHGLTFSGDVYETVREGTTGEIDAAGGHVLGRWTWQTDAASEFALQAYYDHSERLIPAAFQERRDIGSVEVQHRVAPRAGHTLVYGAGFRSSHDTTGGAPLAFTFTPASATLEYYQAFVQDQIRLAPDLELTLGSKFEHNDFTGGEFHPSARLGWQPTAHVFTWTAVSRAVKTPTRIDDGLTALGLFHAGNTGLATEKLVAYEWGLRFWSGATLSADLALFHNDYDDLRSSEPQPGNPLGVFGNGLEGYGDGAELSLGWQPNDRLDLRLFYGFLDLHMKNRPGSGDTGTARRVAGSSPDHQAGLRLAWQPAPAWQVNGFLRYAAELPALNVPAYSELNLRLAWRPVKALELALVGENLLHRRHVEFGTLSTHDELERSGLIELIWAWQ